MISGGYYIAEVLFDSEDPKVDILSSSEYSI